MAGMSKEEYAAMMAVPALAWFVDAHCEFGRGLRTPTRDLWERYWRVCESEGFNVWGRIIWAKELARMGIVSKKSGGVMIVRDVGLKPWTRPVDPLADPTDER